MPELETAPESPPQTAPKESFTEELLGKPFFKQPWVVQLMALPVTVRVLGGLALFAALLYIPYLGAVGLWDPWETHYGEVARSMIQRNDYVIPYWESAWFFSKPVFTMWMMAFGMQVAGTNRTDGALSLMTEWGMRLPFALLSILALALLGLAISRTVSKRAGIASVFALATMPLYFLLSRQAVTDTPVVTTMICAMACAIIAQLDDGTKHRTGWWYGFYVFCAFGCLAKGLLGMIPAAVLFVYALLAVVPWDEKSFTEHVRWLVKDALPLLVAFAIPVVPCVLYFALLAFQATRGAPPDIKSMFGAALIAIGGAAALVAVADRFFMVHKTRPPVFWEQLYKMKLATGTLLLFAVALPWYLKLSFFTGVDDEGKDFFTRFIIHDHFNRLGAGVHTTTPGGSFTYFIEQGGYAIFPWVALVPGAVALLARLRLRGGGKVDHVGVMVFVWMAGVFALMAMSATKFHHYVFPVLPGLAVLIGLFVDRLWEEGIPRHALVLLLGAVLFMIVGADLARDPKDFTDLFVYNYDRPYPVELVTTPIKFLSVRGVWWAELLGVVGVLAGALLVLLTFSSRRDSGLLRPLALGTAFYTAALFIVCSTQSVRPPLLQLGLSLLLVAVYVGYEAWASRNEENFQTSVLALLLAAAAGWLVFRGLAPELAGMLQLGVPRDTVNIKQVLGASFVIAAVVCLLAMMGRARGLLYGSWGVFALGFALWFNWSHWVDLSHHWTQRDLFWRYYSQRKPDEPITAFLMNWRGETYYSKNTVKQIKENPRMTAYAAQPGREWALVEHNRLGILKAAVGQDKNVTQIERDLNNKFVLVTIE